MANKAVELNAAKDKLVVLIKELQVREQEYNEALTHSAHYLGNDTNVEQFRDEKAASAYSRAKQAQKDVESQIKEVQALATEYLDVE